MPTRHIIIQASTDAVLASPQATHSGADITIQNINDEGYIYIGGKGVTTTNFGYKLFPNSAWSVELPGNCELWVCASSELQVAILQTRLEQGS